MFVSKLFFNVLTSVNEHVIKLSCDVVVPLNKVDIFMEMCEKFTELKTVKYV